MPRQGPPKIVRSVPAEARPWQDCCWRPKSENRTVSFSLSFLFSFSFLCIFILSGKNKFFSLSLDFTMDRIPLPIRWHYILEKMHNGITLQHSPSNRIAEKKEKRGVPPQLQAVIINHNLIDFAAPRAITLKAATCKCAVKDRLRTARLLSLCCAFATFLRSSVVAHIPTILLTISITCS